VIGAAARMACIVVPGLPVCAVTPPNAAIGANARPARKRVKAEGNVVAQRKKGNRSLTVILPHSTRLSEERIQLT